MYIYSDGPLPADYRCSLYSHRRQSAILVITSQLLRFCFTEHNLICDCRDSLQTWKLLNLQKANHSTKKYWKFRKESRMKQKSPVRNCPFILKFRKGCFIRHWKFSTTQPWIFHRIENGILGCRKSARVRVFTPFDQRPGNERSWKVIPTGCPKIISFIRSNYS